MPAPQQMVQVGGVTGAGVNISNVGNGVGTVSNVGVGSVAQPNGAAAAPNVNQTQLRRLLAAYRVGMLALETQARRVHDDRPQNKFGRFVHLFL